jgi:hypothetical protein
MTDSSAFDNSIRREEQSALHTEIVRRLAQHGVHFPIRSAASDASLADLLSAVEEFERTVEEKGGDLFVDSPDSSEPDNPELVLPKPTDDDGVESYIRRVTNATRRLQAE